MTRVSTLNIRQRLLRGAQAQVASHAVRFVVQVGGVSILASQWGIHLYGEWLVLFAVPSYLAFSDIGLFSAAASDMIMRVARGDRDGARDVFQATTIAVTALLCLVAIGLVALVGTAPLTSWLHLRLLSDSSVGWVLVALALDTFLIAYAGILTGGFSCEGRYGEAGFALAAISLIEFLSLAGAVLLGGGPVVAATSMLVARFAGTSAMYVAMRRRVPWLRFGRPPAVWSVIRPLVSPALASGALTAALALNVQGMVILVGVQSGPAAVAVFSTLRTLSRAVIQLLTSIFVVITPELSKAFAERDADRLRSLHRGGCQVAVWVASPILLVLAVFGPSIVHIWTGGAISAHGLLLYMFLAVAGLESLWTTSFGVMYARNHHQRLALLYLLSSALALPLAWLLLPAWGLRGAAFSIVLLEVFMLVATLREALPAAHDTLRGWGAALARRPDVLTHILRRASTAAPDAGS
jgi:O-antigen/teichoic acid export membrane protein